MEGCPWTTAWTAKVSYSGQFTLSVPATFPSGWTTLDAAQHLHKRAAAALETSPSKLRRLPGIQRNDGVFSPSKQTFVDDKAATANYELLSGSPIKKKLAKGVQLEARVATLEARAETAEAKVEALEAQLSNQNKTLLFREASYGLGGCFSDYVLGYRQSEWDPVPHSLTKLRNLKDDGKLTEAQRTRLDHVIKWATQQCQLSEPALTQLDAALRKAGGDLAHVDTIKPTISTTQLMENCSVFASKGQQFTANLRKYVNLLARFTSNDRPLKPNLKYSPTWVVEK